MVDAKFHWGAELAPASFEIQTRWIAMRIEICNSKLQSRKFPSETI
jgi:hypothetical protein